jgi:short-subunit dehydrogenase
MSDSQGKKVILITGASSGIGRAAALALAARGHGLALAARRVARLESLARELLDRGGAPPLVLPADVRRREDVESIVKKTHDHYGRLDVFINNAGVLIMEPVLSMPLSDMENIFATNFWPAVHAVRAAAPVMARQGGGHFINVGSGAGRRGLPYMAVYSAGKFALAGLTESMRLELASQNIRFSVIYPGGVETEMPESVDRSRLPRDYPRHIRGISAERAARAVVKAVEKQPLEVYVPWWVRPGAWLSVLFPRLGDFILRKTRMPKGG